MTTNENMELIRLLSLKEKELEEHASRMTSSSDLVRRYADMAKDLREFVEMFEENKK